MTEHAAVKPRQLYTSLHLEKIIVAAMFTALAMQTAAAAPGHDVWRVTPDGVHLHLLEAGAGNKPALVLIPGWRLPASLWSGVLERFSSGRRVIAIDPRSQTPSDITPDGNTPVQRAADLESVLAQEGISRAVLVGWSQGAQDVAAYVQKFGTAKLAGLVFVDAPASGGSADIVSDPETAHQTFRLLTIYAASSRDYTQGMMESIFASKRAPEQQKALIDSALKTPTDIGIAMLISDLYGVDHTPALQRIDCPSLIVAAANSSTLRDQKAMVAKIKGAELETVADSGHAVFIDQPARFDTLLQNFLGKTDAEN